MFWRSIMIPTWCTLVVVFRAKSFKTRSQLAVKDPVPMEGVWDAVNQRSVYRIIAKLSWFVRYFFPAKCESLKNPNNFSGEVVSLNRWCWKHSSHRSRLDGFPAPDKESQKNHPIWFRKGTSYSPVVGWQLKDFWNCHPLFGEDSFFWRTFFKGVGSTTN